MFPRCRALVAYRSTFPGSLARYDGRGGEGENVSLTFTLEVVHPILKTQTLSKLGWVSHYGEFLCDFTTGGRSEHGSTETDAASVHEEPMFPRQRPPCCHAFDLQRSIAPCC